MPDENSEGSARGVEAIGAEQMPGSLKTVVPSGGKTDAIDLPNNLETKNLGMEVLQLPESLGK